MNKDLHSLNKLKSDIRAASLFSFLLLKDQRMKITSLDKGTQPFVVYDG